MALPAARKVSDITHVLEVTAGASYVPGDILSVAGLAGVVLGTENKASGDSMSLALDGVWSIDCASGTTASQGDDAYFNTSTKLVVTAGGSNVIPIGRFGAAKTSGQTKAVVILNDFNLFIPLASQQSLSGAGAVDTVSYYTKWTTSGAQAGTLADGVRIGQMKKVQLIVDGGDGTLTPATFADGSTITFADAGDYVVLVWTASGWKLIESGNDADGATSPSVA